MFTVYYSISLYIRIISTHVLNLWMEKFSKVGDLFFKIIPRVTGFLYLAFNSFKSAKIFGNEVPWHALSNDICLLVIGVSHHTSVHSEIRKIDIIYAIISIVIARFIVWSHQSMDWRKANLFLLVPEIIKRF